MSEGVETSPSLEAGHLVDSSPGDRVHVAGAVEPDERQARARPGSMTGSTRAS